MSSLIKIAAAALSVGLTPAQFAQTQTPPLPPKTVDTPVPPKIELAPPPSASPEIPSRPLTAAESVQIALRLQPSLRAAEANINAAKGRTQQVRAGLLPSLALSLSYSNVSALTSSNAAIVNTNNGTGNNNGNNGNNGGTGTNNTGTEIVTGGNNAGSVGGLAAGYGASATVRQLIYDFNHTRDLVRQSAALERAAGENLLRARNDLALQVKQAYYQYVQNQRLTAVNEANLQNRRNQRDLARARLNSGLGLPADLATAETAYSQSVLTLTLSQNTAEVSRVTLAALLGVDPRTPIQTSPTGEPDPPVNEVNALVNTALARRPEVLQAQASLDANVNAISAAKTANAPAITGVAGVVGRGNDFPFTSDNFGIGVSVAFSPFDGGLTSGRVKEARANLETAKANLSSAKLTVVSDVSQSYLNLKNAEQRVLTAAIAVANAEEGVRIAEGRYRSGLGIFLDIINAQTLLLTAQTGQVEAQLAVETARASLQHALGLGAVP